MSSIEPQYLDDERAEVNSEHAGLLQVESQEVREKETIESQKSNQGKALWMFPERWENMLMPIDDAVTRICQKPSHKIFYIWNVWIIGAFTCIEAGVFAPLVLYTLGLDSQATLVSMVVLALASLSQIPKRVVKRLRPWQAGRAEKKRNDKTSSFPSRAVAGGVCYPFLICACATMDSTGSFRFTWWMAALMVIGALLASFARIHLGCHYLSDCVVGGLLGIVAVSIGYGFFAANNGMCAPLGVMSAYALPGTNQELLLATSYRINWVVLCVGSVIALVMEFLAEVKPLNVWEKSAAIFGLLFPAIIFRLSFSCLPFTGTALPVPGVPSVGAYFVGFGLAGITTGGALLTRGRWGLLVYIALFIINIGTMALWRMGMAY